MKSMLIVFLLLLPAHSVQESSTGGTMNDTNGTSAIVAESRPDTPIRFDGEHGGCGRFQLYAADRERSNFLVVTTDHEMVEIPRAGRSFDLARPPAGVKVYLHRYAAPVKNENYCSDVWERSRFESWSAVAGRLRIRHDGNLHVWAELDALRFRSPDGARTLTGDSVRFDSVRMKWWLD